MHGEDMGKHRFEIPQAHAGQAPAATAAGRGR